MGERRRGRLERTYTYWRDSNDAYGYQPLEYAFKVQQYWYKSNGLHVPVRIRYNALYLGTQHKSRLPYYPDDLKRSA